MKNLLVSATLFVFAMTSHAFAELSFKPVPRAEPERDVLSTLFALFLVIMILLGIWDGFRDKK